MERISGRQRLKKWLVSVGVRLAWCVLWIPLGLLVPLKTHGGAAGWIAPFVGWLAIPELFKPVSDKPRSLDRLDLFINFVLPFFIFWTVFLFSPWACRRVARLFQSPLTTQPD